MAFATPEDIATRFGRELSAIEAATAEWLLDGATAAIAQAADKDDAWAENLSPVPKILRSLCVELARRAMSNPEGLRSMSEQLGAYQHSRSFRDAAAGGDITLTDIEERLVRRTVYGRTSGSAKVGSVLDQLYGTCGS